MTTPEVASALVLKSICPFTSHKCFFIPRIALLFSRITLLFSRKARFSWNCSFVFQNFAFVFQKCCFIFQKCPISRIALQFSRGTLALRMSIQNISEHLECLKFQIFFEVPPKPPQGDLTAPPQILHLYRSLPMAVKT